MSFSLGIVAGICAALCWGIADFLAKIIVDRLGKNGDLKALFWISLAGLLPLTVLFLLFGGHAGISLGMIPMLAMLGAFNFAAYYAFYRGMSKGDVSIVSPIAGSYAALTALVAFAVLGESLGVVRVLGVLLAVVGVALTSTDLSKLRKSGFRLSAGAGEAFISLLGWGVMWALVGAWGKELGWLLPIFGIRMVTFAIVSVFAGRIGPLSGKGLAASVLLLVAAAGVLDVSGYLLASWGMASEMVSIVAPISASFPIITVLLAVYFLKERLALNQVVGIIAVVAGVVALSL